MKDKTERGRMDNDMEDTKHEWAVRAYSDGAAAMREAVLDLLVKVAAEQSRPTATKLLMALSLQVENLRAPQEVDDAG